MNLKIMLHYKNKTLLSTASQKALFGEVCVSTVGRNTGVVPPPYWLNCLVINCLCENYLTRLLRGLHCAMR